jgi:hypothetical protein
MNGGDENDFGRAIAPDDIREIKQFIRFRPHGLTSNQNDVGEFRGLIADCQENLQGPPSIASRALYNLIYLVDFDIPCHDLLEVALPRAIGLIESDSPSLCSLREHVKLQSIGFSLMSKVYPKYCRFRPLLSNPNLTSIAYQRIPLVSAVAFLSVILNDSPELYSHLLQSDLPRRLFNLIITLKSNVSLCGPLAELLKRFARDLPYDLPWRKFLKILAFSVNVQFFSAGLDFLLEVYDVGILSLLIDPKFFRRIAAIYFLQEVRPCRLSILRLLHHIADLDSTLAHSLIELNIADFIHDVMISRDDPVIKSGALGLLARICEWSPEATLSFFGTPLMEWLLRSLSNESYANRVFVVNFFAGVIRQKPPFQVLDAIHNSEFLGEARLILTGIDFPVMKEVLLTVFEIWNGGLQHEHPFYESVAALIGDPEFVEILEELESAENDEVGLIASQMRRDALSQLLE